METKKPTLGESLGSFVASLVDATLSHCDSHKPGAVAGKVIFGGGAVPDTGPGGSTGAETAWAVGVRLGCAPGSTGVPGETMVNLSVPPSHPNGVTLAPPKMLPVPPGAAMPSTTAYPATAPTHAGPGTSSIRVSIDPALPQGLYLGELRGTPTSGAVGPRCPVVIYLDGLP